jgi:hypothetical protein
MDSDAGMLIQLAESLAYTREASAGAGRSIRSSLDHQEPYQKPWQSKTITKALIVKNHIKDLKNQRFFQIFEFQCFAKWSVSPDSAAVNCYRVSMNRCSINTIVRTPVEANARLITTVPLSCIAV